MLFNDNTGAWKKKKIYSFAYKNKCLLTDNEIGAKNQILGSYSLECEMTSLDTVANLFTAYVFARQHADITELLFHAFYVLLSLLLKNYLNNTEVIIHSKEIKYRFCLLQQYLFFYKQLGLIIYMKMERNIKQSFGRTFCFLFMVCHHSTTATLRVIQFKLDTIDSKRIRRE